jgi:hypothetical protein
MFKGRRVPGAPRVRRVSSARGPSENAACEWERRAFHKVVQFYAAPTGRPGWGASRRESSWPSTRGPARSAMGQAGPVAAFAKGVTLFGCGGVFSSSLRTLVGAASLVCSLLRARGTGAGGREAGRQGGQRARAASWTLFNAERARPQLVTVQVSLLQLRHRRGGRQLSARMGQPRGMLEDIRKA